MRRILLTVAAVLIPVAGISTLGMAGTAGAATGKITCTTISGNASSTVTVSGCTGGNTGGSSEAMNSTDLESGGTIDWVSGSTTTISAPQLTTISEKKCPGYVKPTKTNPSPSEPTAESFTASVTADTGDGILLPATATGEVCVSQSGSISDLKKLEIEWTESSITCTTITGNASSTVTVSGCTGGDTGGSSQPINSTALESGGTIDWVSGSNTTISAPTLTATSAKDCPGYVKPPKTGPPPSEPTADNIAGNVTADSGDGLKLPGTFKGAVCIGTDGSVTALKPLSAK
jgi:hypothetical protein